MKRKIQWGTVIFLGIYFVVVAYVCLLSEAYGRTELQKTYHYNLIPFREIIRFYTYREQVGIEAFVLNLFGNVFAFVPFGFMVPIINWRFRQVGRAAGLSLYLSLMVECVQLITRVGALDVDDLMLNTMGGILGYWIFYLTNQIRRRWFGQNG